MISKIQLLKKYFRQRPDVVMAFIFGSQAKRRVHTRSDWDVAVYFKPKEYLELETERNFLNENKIWSDLIDILKTDDLDFLVLNRAASDLVYSILRDGLPLKIKDRRLYLELFCKSSYEAVDWWEFIDDFWKMSEKAHSLLPEERAILQRYLRFLETEFEEIKEIKKFGWQDYRNDPFKRKIMERWIENLVITSLDIPKIILASEKSQLPQSYKDTLKIFTTRILNFSLKEAETFSDFAKFRNIVVHEYLDIKHKRIKNFIKEAEKLYPKFIEAIKDKLCL